MDVELLECDVDRFIDHYLPAAKFPGEVRDAMLVAGTKVVKSAFADYLSFRSENEISQGLDAIVDALLTEGKHAEGHKSSLSNGISPTYREVNLRLMVAWSRRCIDIPRYFHYSNDFDEIGPSYAHANLRNHLRDPSAFEALAGEVAAQKLHAVPYIIAHKFGCNSNSMFAPSPIIDSPWAAGCPLV